MKTIVCLLLLLTRFNQGTPLVSASDAEKVLGMRAQLSAHTSKEKDGVIKQELAYSGMAGQEKINGLGDEAFFHTDKKHFDLLIFRKDSQMVTLKINRITSKTSVTELRRLAAKLEQGL